MPDRPDNTPPTPLGKHTQATSKIPSTVEPLDPATLTARRTVILAKRRARRLAKPAYISSDTSWREGVAGLAYVSGSLGNRAALVSCPGPIEAEYLALLMAMEDADRAQLPGLIDFRVGSAAIAHLAVETSPALVQLRALVKRSLDNHQEWRLVLVEGKRNRAARGMAHRMLRGWREGAKAG